MAAQSGVANVTYGVPTENSYSVLGGVNSAHNGVGGGVLTGTDHNRPLQGNDQSSQLSTDGKLSLLLAKIDKLENNQQQIIAIATRQNVTEQRVTKLERQLHDGNLFAKQLAYHSIDIEARSRRNNLVFYGLAEFRHEDTYETLGSFMNDYLDLEIDQYCVQRVHRVGSIQKALGYSQTPRRPIIVAFRDYKDTEYILNMARNLKGTRFGIDRDYPKEISMARKRLWGRYKEEKADQRSKVKLVYPAKLVVNGRVIADEFPDWSDILRVDRCESAKRLVLTSENTHDYSCSTVVDSVCSASQMSAGRSMSISTGSTADSCQTDTTRSPSQHQQTLPADTTIPTERQSQQTQDSQSILREPRLTLHVQPQADNSFCNGRGIDAAHTSTPRQLHRGNNVESSTEHYA